MADWLVLVGPHGSGKTTLAREVARSLAWVFDEEIGERLRRERMSTDPSAHAFRSQEGFDREVCRLELERDLARRGVSRVVETWHPGNLSYVRRRSPDVFEELWEQVAPAVRACTDRVLVQPLEIGEQVLAARLREPGPADPGFVPFLHSVGLGATSLARDLGLFVFPGLDTSRVAPEDACRSICARLEEAG